MSTIKLILEYDGTGYAGWQRQPDQPTIQEAVEAAIVGSRKPTSRPSERDAPMQGFTR